MSCRASFDTAGRRSRRSLHLFRALHMPLAIQLATLLASFCHLRLTGRLANERPRSTPVDRRETDFRARERTKRTLGRNVFQGARSRSRKRSVILRLHVQNGSITCQIASTGSLRSPFTFPVSRWWMSNAVKTLLFACTISHSRLDAIFPLSFLQSRGKKIDRSRLRSRRFPSTRGNTQRKRERETDRQKRSSTAGNLRSIVAKFDTNVAIDISQLSTSLHFQKLNKRTRIRGFFKRIL